MDSNKQHRYNGSSSSKDEFQEADADELISIEQLQRLVRLLDHSDVSEIELKHMEAGIRLVLRKTKVSVYDQQGDLQPSAELAVTTDVPAQTEHTVVAPLVGIFHSWAKPKGGSLVAVGDHVRVGQLIATIQSLNVINEVESPVAGRVIEILVQDGQAVEYGQPLMIIDSREEPK
jgi:acetyl-CoA carboxylase biotin carboxyl carrier protein